ncbi:hypothetical protein Acor_45370 [Acrocarpospora corrugata]|uniref:Uncharacterized protein n=1 Tax=Acrocarpospora corrugata TaxID=35763 RepID=A0A5M3W5N0_9ACTN|nr:hypothetical protein Acor_45370 [Acrocarpospora corrugata]
MRVPPGQNDQVTGRERLNAAVMQNQVTPPADHDVHPALLKPDLVRITQLDPAIGGTLEAQLPQHKAQDIHGTASLGKTNTVVLWTITHE